MVNEFENLLRDLIITKLGNESNNYNISPERIAKWTEKKEIELARDLGLKESRIIYYSDFYDLQTIINKNWEDFKPILKDKKRFEIFFKEVEKYRNNVAHGRELLKSQKLLLEGMLLDLKNLRAIYHNRNEMKEDYFIRINKISDNLGNVWTSGLNSCHKPIRVGDYYELVIDAVDPKNREIQYEVRSLNLKLKIVQKENTFGFEISENLISSQLSILFYARTPESEYKNETHISVVYTIIPQR